MADPEVSQLFNKLSVRGKVLAEYIWIGGTGTDLHSKTKVLDAIPNSPEELPVWHFDGSATGQAPDHLSVVYLKPRSIHPDPFRGGDHILVLCDCHTPPALDGDSATSQLLPHQTNNRAPCERVMAAAADSSPVFSVEQQYTLLNPTTMWPLGWPERGGVACQPGKAYYCSVGVGQAAGRDFADAHFKACLHAGLRVTGVAADMVPGQWAYKIGPCSGLELGDHLWLSRYLLLRTGEKFSLVASLDPKPVPGDWGGSGAPVKFSTRETRAPGSGWAATQMQVHRLEAAHLQHMMLYGAGNDRRLTGGPRTSSVLQFSWGVESRAVSVRVPHAVVLHQRGYYEDRRPASNMDPYLVCMMLVCTTLGVPLPLPLAAGLARCGAPLPGASCEQDCSSETSGDPSRGSSAILDELEELESFAPDTPPQAFSLLAGECSSEHNPGYRGHCHGQVESGACSSQYRRC